MSGGFLEPPPEKIFGGFAEPMQVRVFEPPADATEPPRGAEQSPFSRFQSFSGGLWFPGVTSPSSSNTEVGVTAHATLAVARIAVAPRGIKIRLELKNRINPQMGRIDFFPLKGGVSHFDHRDTIGRRHEQ